MSIRYVIARACYPQLRRGANPARRAQAGNEKGPTRDIVPKPAP